MIFLFRNEKKKTTNFQQLFEKVRLSNQNSKKKQKLSEDIQEVKDICRENIGIGSCVIYHGVDQQASMSLFIFKQSCCFLSPFFIIGALMIDDHESSPSYACSEGGSNYYVTVGIVSVRSCSSRRAASVDICVFIYLFVYLLRSSSF